MGAARKYPDELRDRAVRLVLDLVKDQDVSVTAACRKVGGELGIKADTLRGWAKQAQIDRGLRPGTASADAARIRALERENAELRRGGYKVRTTRPDPSQGRPEDLVNRDFAPDAPDRLWVVDFTFVPTWAGTAYTALVIDAFSRLIARVAHRGQPRHGPGAGCAGDG